MKTAFYNLFFAFLFSTINTGFSLIISPAYAVDEDTQEESDETDEIENEHEEE